MAKDVVETKKLVPVGVDLSAAVEQCKTEQLESTDVTFPFLKIAQALSPELKLKDQYPGLEVGKWFNTATGEVYLDGVDFIPVYYQRTYILWNSRNKGGGFRGDVGLTQGVKMAAQCVKLREDDVIPTGWKDEKTGELLELKETAYWAGFILKNNGTVENAIIPFTSSYLKVSRQWNTKITQYVIEGASGYIRWARPYKLQAIETKNQKGNWFIPVIIPHEKNTFEISVDIWKNCIEFNKQLQEMGGLTVTPPEIDEPIEDGGATGDLPF